MFGKHSRQECRKPFTDFIEHQMKLVVMMATGGTLASLAEAQGIGSGASDTQQDEWLRIIRADKRIISNAINKQICEQIIRSCKDFKGKPTLAEFRLDSDPKPTAKELAELAQSFSSAGFEMDAEELSRLSGYKITKKVGGDGMGFNADMPPNVSKPGVIADAPKADNAATDAARTPSNAVAEPGNTE